MSNKKSLFQFLGPTDALILSIGIIFVFSFLMGTSAFATSVSFPFFDPFTHSSEPTNNQIQTAPPPPQAESPKDGCAGQNCDSLYGSYLTEQLNQLLMSKANEICGAGESSECNQLNNLGPVNQGNQSPVPETGGNVNGNSLIPEQEICGDLKDNDGNGLVDENCGPVSSGGSGVTQNNPSSAMPEQEICGDKQDNDGNGLVDENCGTSSVPKTTPASSDTGPSNKPNGKGTDKFGIREIYPTKPNGEEWFMNDHPEKDPRFSPQTQLTPNSDGSFKVTSTKVRMGAFTSSGYKPSQIATLDHSKIAAKGYMQSPNDWRDVEITGYVKLNSGSGDNFAWYARGGRHTGFGNPEGCEGVAYKGDLYYNGQTRWTKEQWHTGGYVFGDYQKGMGPLNGKWVGFKAIMYNIQDAGKIAVKLEIWLDRNNDNQWTKVNERVDNGGWGNNGGECGGQPDQIITWGGPIASYRWDSASNVDIKNFSVREIQPT